MNYISALLWNVNDTLKLIDLWQEYETKFSSGAFTKKSLWMEIASRLYSPTFKPSFENCCNKWKGLCRTYKNIHDNNSKTGREHQNFKYYEAMDQAIGKRPENTNFVGRASSLAGFNNTNLNTNAQSETSVVEAVEPLENTNDTLTAVNDEINEPIPKRKKSTKSPEWFVQLQEAQDKRHKENIEAKTRITNVMEKFFEKIIEKM